MNVDSHRIRKVFLIEVEGKTTQWQIPKALKSGTNFRSDSFAETFELVDDRRDADLAVVVPEVPELTQAERAVIERDWAGMPVFAANTMDAGKHWDFPTKVFKFHGFYPLQANTEISPGYVRETGEDLFLDLQVQTLPERAKGAQPTIGFMGRDCHPRIKAVRGKLPKAFNDWAACARIATQLPLLRGIAYGIRHECLETLQRSPLVLTQFQTNSTNLNPLCQGDLRQWFIKNLMDSTYTLCARGAENYSFRLFEALSLGVIPVIVVTGPLPQRPGVNWNEIAVLIEPREIPRMGERILEDFQRMSEAQYQARRERCRKAFEALAPGGFYTSVITRAMAQENPEPEVSALPGCWSVQRRA